MSGADASTSLSLLSLSKSGFTLVELLVVTSLLAMVFLTAYSALAAGVRIWKRVESSVKEVDLALGWKRLRKDLVGRLPYPAIGFSGAPREVSFPGLVTVKDPEGRTHEEVGRIRYLFEESCRCLCREETTYADVGRGTSSDCRPVISSVGSASFEYYGLEEISSERGVWRSEWTGEPPPLAVRLKIALEEGEGKIEKQFTATSP